MKQIIQTLFMSLCLVSTAMASPFPGEELYDSTSIKDWVITVFRDVQKNTYRIDNCTRIYGESGRVCVSWNPQTPKDKLPLSIWIFRDCQTCKSMAGQMRHTALAVRIDNKKPIAGNDGILIISENDMMKMNGFSWNIANSLINELKNGYQLTLMSSNHLSNPELHQVSLHGFKEALSEYLVLVDKYRD